jgi:hypothetical protein
MDQFPVAELFLVSQPGGLLPDVGLVAHRRRERQGETLALGLTPGAGVFEVLCGLKKLF